MLSKEKFCKYIADMQATYDLDCRLSNVFNESGGTFCMPQPYDELEMDVAALLAESFHAKNTRWIQEEIEYFCYEADFGRKYHDGMVTDKDGNNIDIGTSEKLYDYIVKEYC